MSKKKKNNQPTLRLVSARPPRHATNSPGTVKDQTSRWVHTDSTNCYTQCDGVFMMWGSADTTQEKS